jgi:hypothetical protein
MVTNSISKIGLGENGSVSVKVSKIKKKLSKDDVFDILLENFPEEESEKLITKFFDGSEEEVTKLERKKK